MSIDPQLFHQAQTAFNSIKVMKGQVATIATCDTLGHPNVAPIGSMRVVDFNTVHVLQGLLPRTMKNLQSNPRAAFSVILPMTLGSALSMFRSGNDAAIGYRVYGELTSIEDDQAAVKLEAHDIVKRVPYLLRGAFTRFCDKNLKRILKFRILEIRAT
jgi:predicted pyridoxine 5'-phosphate oxidase superfamily flavin-nucleotide-binding protein